MKKLYAIGDVHGCHKALKKLLVKIGEDKGDDEATIVFLGDYVDRGSDSRGVIETIMGLQEFSKRAGAKTSYVFLRGNHEEMMIDPNARKMSSMWIPNGGDTTLKSYHGDEDTFAAHCDWIRDNTSFYYREEGYFFVHAGIDPMVPYATQDPELMVWARNWTNYDGDYYDSVFVVHGHTPVPKPKRHRNQLNIDTGCVFSKNYPEYLGLTAAILHDGPDDIRFLHAKEYLL